MKHNRTWYQQWRGVFAAAGLSLGLAGCEGKNPEPPGIQKSVSLQAFTGAEACRDLENYIEDTAVLQMRTQLEAQRDSVPGWGWWGGFGRFGVQDEAGGPVATAAPDAKAAPTDYTQTNNQVAGVDEADFVKNDGTRIFVLSGNKLFATKSWPAAQTAVQGKLAIEGWPREMFLEGQNRAVVFSQVYKWYPLSNSRGVSCIDLGCGYYSSNTVKVTVVDVSNMSDLKVVKEVFYPGYYNSARKIDSSVRLVLTDNFNFPQGFKWGPDWRPGLFDDKAGLKAAYNSIIASNEKLIREQTLAEWVPGSVTVENGQKSVTPMECSNFAKANAPTRLGQVSVVTLNLASNRESRTTILGEAGEIYASKNNLYVATKHWWWWPAPGQTDTTYLHKFDISSPDAALYVASGNVDGHIVDQFSMDEAASGHFRVVTTITSRVPDKENPNNWWGRTETTNRLSVLGEKDGILDVVGQSEDLAKGERVMSSRIVGNKGFVVTFRQVDPLFTFDLSNPLAPKKVGELKIPGFSTYMHPIDENHLLTIGTFVPEPVNGVAPNWRDRALQLAIFDVTDMAHPKQTHVQLVGNSSSYSEAQHDHKAFNYFAAKKLLAIPFINWDYNWNMSGNGYYWSRFTSELRVFNIDPINGFTAKGAVSMSDMYQVQNYYNWTYFYTPSVRRSVMADDFVYAISDSGLRVANINNMTTPVATANFTRYIDVNNP
jgi:uncharacterized secreted protein with C-terminal beta-propeller domain